MAQKKTNLVQMKWVQMIASGVLGVGLGLITQTASADFLRVSVKVNGDPNVAVSSLNLQRLEDGTIRAEYGVGNSGQNILPENLGLPSDLSADFNSQGLINIRSKRFPASGPWHIAITSGQSVEGRPAAEYVEQLEKAFLKLKLGLIRSIEIVGPIQQAPMIKVTID